MHFPDFWHFSFQKFQIYHFCIYKNIWELSLTMAPDMKIETLRKCSVTFTIKSHFLLIWRQKHLMTPKLYWALQGQSCPLYMYYCSPQLPISFISCRRLRVAGHFRHFTLNDTKTITKSTRWKVIPTYLVSVTVTLQPILLLGQSFSSHEEFGFSCY